MAPFDRSYTTFYWSAIVNIALSCTVFELFDVKWNNDLEIWVRGHSESVKMAPFESLGAVSYSHSIVTMALSFISSEKTPDIGRKSWFFSYPLAFVVPVSGSRSKYCHPVWYGKTRMVEKNFEDMYNRLHTYWRVTDRRTDRQTNRQTSCHGIVRAMHTRRAVKTARTSVKDRRRPLVHLVLKARRRSTHNITIGQC